MFRQNQSFINTRQNSFFEMLKKKATYILKALERIEVDLMKKRKTNKVINNVEFLRQLRFIISMNQTLVNEIKNDFQMSDLQLMGEAIQRLFFQQTSIIYYLINLNLKKEEQVLKNYKNQQMQLTKLKKSISSEQKNDYRKHQHERYDLTEIIKYQLSNKRKEQQGIWKLLNKNLKQQIFICNNFESSKQSQVLTQVHNMLTGTQYYNRKFMKSIQDKINASIKKDQQLEIIKFQNTRQIKIKNLEQFTKKLIDKIKQLSHQCIKVSVFTQTPQYQIKNPNKQKQKLKMELINSQEVEEISNNQLLRQYIKVLQKNYHIVKNNSENLLKAQNNQPFTQDKEVQMPIRQSNQQSQKLLEVDLNQLIATFSQNSKIRNQKTNWKNNINQRMQKQLQSHIFSKIKNIRPHHSQKNDSVVYHGQFRLSQPQGDVKFTKIQPNHNDQEKKLDQPLEHNQQPKLYQQKNIYKISQDTSLFGKLSARTINRLKQNSKEIRTRSLSKKISIKNQIIVKNTNIPIVNESDRNVTQNKQKQFMIFSNIVSVSIKKRQIIETYLEEKQNSTPNTQNQSKNKNKNQIKKVFKKGLFTQKKSIFNQLNPFFQPLNITDKQLGLKILLKKFF